VNLTPAERKVFGAAFQWAEAQIDPDDTLPANTEGGRLIDELVAKAPALGKMSRRDLAVLALAIVRTQKLASGEVAHGA
jgi:hypothetical protein